MHRALPAYPLSPEPEPASERVAFGAALRLLRSRTGFKQYHVAELSGVTKGMLSGYETGRQRPSLESLERILDTLSCDFRDLQDALDAVRGPQPMADGASSAEDRQRRVWKAVLEIVHALEGKGRGPGWTDLGAEDPAELPPR